MTSAAKAPDPSQQPRRWAESLSVYSRPAVLRMLLLGFSAGLPFLLVFSTLNAWLASAGVSRTAIGLFSWIGITYSIKVLWAPVVDKLKLPLLTGWLGQRRGWMLLSQLGLAIAFATMAQLDPRQHLALLAVVGLFAAFCSATQDITIDAYRIESEVEEFQAAMASTYVLGYRVALLVAGAGALYLADYFSWRMAYMVMAGCMGVGILAVLVSPEPQRKKALTDLGADPWVARFAGAPGASPLRAWFTGAVIAPLAAFLSRYGWQSVSILLLVGLYKISDISMAAMANPLYIELGFSLSEIASVTKLFGLTMTIVGGLAGGVLVARYGIPGMMLVGALLVAVTNLFFAWLATVGYSIPALFVTIGADNFSNGFASVTLIAWLSSLVDQRYTATQYALLSSLMTLPGKFIGGFSGFVVDAYGFVAFFLYVAAMGIPAILLCSYFLFTGRGKAPD